MDKNLKVETGHAIRGFHLREGDGVVACGAAVCQIAQSGLRQHGILPTGGSEPFTAPGQARWPL